MSSPLHKPLFFHVTVRARLGLYPFVDQRFAAWAWVRLARSFPSTLAAVLMPDHLHLVMELRADSLRRLRGILGSAAYRFGYTETCGAMWAPIDPPSPLRSLDKLRRSVRYTWLNPCRPWRRAGMTHQLVDDPLHWVWSTFRDLVGATASPWAAGAAVAEALAVVGREAVKDLHGYVVRDGFVSDRAHRFPSAPSPSRAPDRALEEVVDAALVATRLPREALRRRSSAREAAIGLAYRQGWRHPTALASRFGVHPTTVTRIARRARPSLVEAAALCLDPRLKRPEASTRRDAAPGKGPIAAPSERSAPRPPSATSREAPAYRWGPPRPTQPE